MKERKSHMKRAKGHRLPSGLCQIEIMSQKVKKNGKVVKRIRKVVDALLFRFGTSLYVSREASKTASNSPILQLVGSVFVDRVHC
jgi:hypothetical protein